jgi:hypothetical protein
MAKILDTDIQMDTHTHIHTDQYLSFKWALGSGKDHDDKIF